jgi:hypothetical protein
MASQSGSRSKPFYISLYQRKSSSYFKQYIGFFPEEKLKQDTKYRITLKLSKIIKTSKNLAEFKFSIKCA